MLEIILHLGYPKTGTTSLQKHVFPNLEGIIYLGKYYHEDSDQAFYFFQGKKINSFSVLLKVLKNSEGLKGKFLISNEDIVYNLLRENILSINTSKEKVFEFYSYIKNITQCTNLGIILGIRDQAELIHSIYAQSYYAYFGSIKEVNTYSKFVPIFLKNKGWILNYSDFISEIPCSNLKVYNFKDFNTDEFSTIRETLHHFGIKLNSKLFKIKIENQRKIKKGIKKTQSLNFVELIKQYGIRINPNLKSNEYLDLLIQKLKLIKIKKPLNITQDVKSKTLIERYYK